MKKSTISKQWSYTTDLFSTLAVKSHKLSMLWLMLFTLLLVPTSMVAETTTEDPRYVLFKGLEGITDVTITDNGNYPWRMLDSNAEGMQDLGFTIPEGSKGLMSSNYKVDKSSSETVIRFNVSKPILLTSQVLVSSEFNFDIATITLDNKESWNISGIKQKEIKALLSVGEHSLKLSYNKDGSTNEGADRAFIYGLETATTISDYVYVAESDATNTTLTFKKFTPDNWGSLDLSRMAIVNNERTVKEMCTNNYSSIKNIIFDESFKTYAPTSLKDFFISCNALETISGLEYLNTANVENMSYMFYDCSALKSLDLTNFNTAKVEYMNNMFDGCSALESLNLTNFNTANVENMSYMFYDCSALKSLDLTNFNTAKVEYMNNMFDGCSALESLNLTNFNTAKVEYMNYMFDGCSALESLNLTNFNTAEVTNMSYMFKGCSALTSLDLTNFNTAKVEYMSNMFEGCSALTTIYVSDKFVTSQVTYSDDMFNGCKSLKGFIEHINNTDKTNHNYANYTTGYFTKLVVKNGDERYGITGETTQLTVDNLALADNKDFVAYEQFAAKDASYSRTINTTWATLCLPFEVSLTDQHFRAFKLLSADEGTNTVELEELKTSIAAGTPVIIKMKDGETQLKFSVANKAIAKDVQTSETANGNYQLQGLYTQKEFSKDADNNCYIVKGNKLMNPAMLLEKTKVQKVASKPFRAYMVEKSSAPAAGAKMFSIAIGGGTTAIDNLNTIANDKAEYYDLQGKRLNEPQKGINIVKRGNKTMKVIIK
ncbi:BspA family leucine-rich repeat surface protein [Prevotella sp.]|uniref:BspA family leucine-rich repeat surface protein n=1 Tax=Prevotella sp. TaxID=59823 RepID=UPI0027E2FA68|nr:BspA family leucine-rich repeat surface protein [Prevotella sp.]